MTKLRLFLAYLNFLYLGVQANFVSTSGSNVNATNSTSTSSEVEKFEEVRWRNVSLDSSKLLTLFKCAGSDISFDVFTVPSELLRRDEAGNQADVKARFKESYLDCGSSYIIELVQDYGSENETEIDMYFYEHGWLLVFVGDNRFESVPPEKYCISSVTDTSLTVNYCQSDCTTEPCISKCCPVHQVCDLGLDEFDCECTDSGDTKWTSVVNMSLEPNVSFVHYAYSCGESEGGLHFTLNKGSMNLMSANQNDFKIADNGSVLFKRELDGAWLTFPEGTYCIDGAVRTDEEGGGGHFSGDFNDMVLHVCRYIPPEEPIFLPIATFFIILTISVYSLTWTEQNLHGYTIFFYLTSLLVLYLFLIVRSIPAIASPQNNPKLCSFIAAAIHYSYLSTICWLTSISFDVWRTFRKMSYATLKGKGLGKFCLYCIFSFGYPLVQVGVCAGLDATYRGTPEGEDLILPNYGDEYTLCTMSNEAVTYYLYIPIGILMSCNVILFIATILTMADYKKSIHDAFARIDSNANTSSKANQSFGVFVRLFIIMGIFWIVQIITWFVENRKIKMNSEYIGLEILFGVTDALTFLQAVAIFYIFVCKSSVFGKLWNLQPWLRPFLALWIQGGCCTSPSPDLRKASGQNAAAVYHKGSINSRKGSSGNGNQNRTSRDSDSSSVVFLANQSQTNKALTEKDRKISAMSNSTVLSEVDSGGRSSWENKPAAMAIKDNSNNESLVSSPI